MPPRLSPLAFTLVAPPAPPPPQVKHLICLGLGNLPYPTTKHSIGHLLIDSISTDLGFPSFSSERSLGGLVSEGYIDHPKLGGGVHERVKVTLVKPKPLMNLTGLTLSKLLLRYPLPSIPNPGETQYFLIHDHLDFEEGKIQIRLGGSHGGHNGMRSCLNVAGKKRAEEIWQCRVGVGRPLVSMDAEGRRGERERRKDNVVDYVMSDISRVQFDACSPGGPSTNRVWDDIKWAAFEHPLRKASMKQAKKNPRPAVETIE